MDIAAELQTINQIYPVAKTVQLKGLYLSHDIRTLAAAQDAPYIYANFVSSLDGRIAVPHRSGDGLTVPKNVANDRDWRLFQELVAQSDVIISTGRYLREWAEGRAQEILRVDDPQFSDLREWRKQKELSPQPDIAIISRELDFPIPSVLQEGGRRVLVFTTEQADSARIAAVESQLGSVFVVGKSDVDGRQMADELGALQYRTVYSAAGPRILHMLLAAGVLNRLYRTQVNRIVGGDPFSSIVDGALLPSPMDFQLKTLYLDPAAIVEEKQAIGQLLFSYDRA